MVAGRSIFMVAGGNELELRLMVSVEDSARKEHFHGCWRSGDGVAVDGECGKWCKEGALPWLLEVTRWSCGRW